MISRYHVGWEKKADNGNYISCEELVILACDIKEARKVAKLAIRLFHEPKRRFRINSFERLIQPQENN